MATIGMIALTVEDWYEEVDFYNLLLRMPIIESDEVVGRARLQAGEALVLEINSGGWGSEGPKTPRENPITLCVHVDDLEKVAYELEGEGACFLIPPERGQALLMDPEGNRILLYDTPVPPPPPDGWESIQMDK